MLTAILSLWVSGCLFKTDCDGSYRVAENTFSPLEVDSINSAVTRLNKFAGHRSVSIAPNGQCLIQKESFTEHTGYYHGENGTIGIDAERIHLPYMTDSYYSYSLEAVIIHEFLHSLGMKHIPGKGVMNNEVADKEFTEGDRIACVTAGICF